MLERLAELVREKPILLYTPCGFCENLDACREAKEGTCEIAAEKYRLALARWAVLLMAKALEAELTHYNQCTLEGKWYHAEGAYSVKTLAKALADLIAEASAKEKQEGEVAE